MLVLLTSDYQGQGHNGYFGNGYLRMYTIDPSAGTLKTLAYSPPAAAHPTRFPKNDAGTPVVPPVTRTDPYNKFTIPFEAMSVSKEQATVTIQSPTQGSTVSSPVTVKATYSGTLPPNHFEVWDNGIKLGNAAVSSSDTMSASFAMGAGAHGLVVLAVDSQANVIKSSRLTFTSK